MSYEYLLDGLVIVTEKILKLGELTCMIHTPELDASLDLQSHADTLFGVGNGSTSMGRLRMIKYTLGFFLVYPVGILFRLLPNRTIKNIFSLFVGLFLIQYVFERDWIHPMLTSTITYLLCKYAPRKYFASLVFFWMMFYMTASHIYIMYTNYLSPNLDFTNVQMVITMKMTSFAYNYHDGTVDSKKVYSDDHKESAMKMYKSRRKYAIQKLPNLIEYYGYVFCFTCILAGPAFEYKDYSSVLDDSCFQLSPEMSNKVSDEEKKRISKYKPSSLLPSFINFIIAIITLVIHLTISASYPISNMSNPTFLSQQPFYITYLLCCFTLIGERTRYFFAWKLAESSCIAAGFGFQGWKLKNDNSSKIVTNTSFKAAANGDGNGGNKVVPIGWNGVSNVDILGFEFATTSQQVSKAWNTRTGGWLQRYTYLRVPRSYGRGLALGFTYFISALWHGLYPGYFFFFLSVAVVQWCEGLVRLVITPLICPEYNYNRDEPKGSTILSCPKTGQLWYWIASWATTHGMFNILVQPFSQRSFEQSVRTQAYYHWIPHIFVMCCIPILLIIQSRIKSKTKKE